MKKLITISTILSLLLVGMIQGSLEARPPCPGNSCKTPSPTPTGFVQRSGTHLLLNGQSYTFTGINIYNANSRSNCWYSLGNNDAGFANTLTSSGVRSFRAWFDQGLATTNGVRDWAAFDHTISVAHQMGVKVIPVLSVADCQGEGIASRQTDWLSTGYKTTIVPWQTVTFRAWLKEVATRYRNETAILMWQIGNEWEIKNPDGTCGPATTLKVFADDTAAVVKAADPNHLVSLGTIGSGQCGAQGATEYQNLHSSPNIDLCEYHDYDHASEPMPGDQWNGLQTRIDACNALNKPMFVGETGIPQSDPNRSSEFQAKRDTELAAGIVGWLPWEWRAAGQTGGDIYIIPAGDPTLKVINGG